VYLSKPREKFDSSVAWNIGSIVIVAP